MKSFIDFLGEAKLSYDDAYDIYMAEIKELKEAGYEQRNRGATDSSGGVRFGYARGTAAMKTDGERREYDIWVGFTHNNYSRINNEVTTRLTRTDGSNQHTGSAIEVDAKKHKNIKAAIKYGDKILKEKAIEEFAKGLYILSKLSIEDIKRRGLFSILYINRSYTNVGNEADAIKFINKLKKANISNETAGISIAKKYIKKV